jgi:hypothetical protein
MYEAERKILDLLEKFHSNTATAGELSGPERWYAEKCMIFDENSCKLAGC